MSETPRTDPNAPLVGVTSPEVASTTAIDTVRTEWDSYGLAEAVPDHDDATLPSAAPVADVQSAGGPARSLWSDAWDTMRRNPLFWIALVLIAVLLVMSIAPGLFTSLSPEYCDLNMARQGPQAGHPFGYDIQGCDVYARTIYGARASIIVGTVTTLLVAGIGIALGTLAGYLGGIVDTVISRFADMIFAIPLLLGGIVLLYTVFHTGPGAPYAIVVGKVVIALAILAWPGTFRLMRSSVMQVKPNEYVQAARALGAKPFRIVASHVIPNALAPVIVTSTIDLGAYIATEATLSFLGIGLQPPAISWGIAISEASGLGYVRTAPHMLLFPSLFLSITVLSFIMLGEVVRDALDPKLR